LTDNELSLPFEAHVQGKQTMDNKEQNGLTYAQKYHPVLKDYQEIKINTAPFATGIEEKNDKMLPENYCSIIPKGTTSVSVNETQSPINTTSMKSIITNGIFSLVENLLPDEGFKKEQGKASSLDKITTESKNIFFSIENKNSNHDSSLKLQMVQEPAKVDRINDNIFVTAKSGDASIRVSLEPDGIGKIDIELVLNRGVINAQINTSETVGKEFIEKNLHNILSSLINEGLNIGSFSVSLQNKGGEMKDDGSKEDLQVFRVKEAIQLPFAQPNMGIVNIFV
jgi:flagellar hook-length control protein FliK